MRHAGSRRLEPLAVFLLCASVLFAGCGWVTDETDSEEGDLGIQPLSVTLDADEISDVVFTVWGGSGVYAWSLGDDSLGTLVSGDATAIYTSKAVVGENTITATDGDYSITATVNQE